MPLRLRKNDAGITYLIPNLESIEPDLDMPTQAFAIPELGWRLTDLIKVEGNVLGFTLSWKLIHETDSTVEGRTGSNAVRTPIHQMMFLVTEMEARGLEASYTLTVIEDNMTEHFDGTISKFSFKRAKDEPNTYIAHTKFHVGVVITNVRDTDETDDA